jgi:hypothetical protein
MIFIYLIGFKVLSRVGFGAKMYLAFLSSHQEQMVLEFVEVKAHSTGKAIQESFFLIFD